MTAEVIQFVPRANYGRSPVMDTLPVLKAEHGRFFGMPPAHQHVLTSADGSWSYLDPHYAHLTTPPDGDCA